MATQICPGGPNMRWMEGWVAWARILTWGIRFARAGLRCWFRITGQRGESGVQQSTTFCVPCRTGTPICVCIPAERLTSS